jgi:hypothetical protein
MCRYRSQGLLKQVSSAQSVDQVWAATKAVMGLAGSGATSAPAKPALVSPVDPLLDLKLVKDGYDAIKIAEVARRQADERVAEQARLYRERKGLQMHTLIKPVDTSTSVPVTFNPQKIYAAQNIIADSVALEDSIKRNEEKSQALQLKLVQAQKELNLAQKELKRVKLADPDGNQEVLAKDQSECPDHHPLVAFRPLDASEEANHICDSCGVKVRVLFVD